MDMTCDYMHIVSTRDVVKEFGDEEFVHPVDQGVITESGC